jgi:hypothetical protein
MTTAQRIRNKVSRSAMRPVSTPIMVRVEGAHLYGRGCGRRLPAGPLGHEGRPDPAPWCRQGVKAVDGESRRGSFCSIPRSPAPIGSEASGGNEVTHDPHDAPITGGARR